MLRNAKGSCKLYGEQVHGLATGTKGNYDFEVQFLTLNFFFSL